MVHTDNDYFATGYDLVLEAAYLVYKRQGSSEEFRAANNGLLANMTKTPSHRLYVDVRGMGVVAPDDQRWVGNTIIPQLANNAPGNYLYIAILVSQKIFTQLAVTTIEDISNGKGICLNRHFYSASEAKHWLTQQKKRVA